MANELTIFKFGDEEEEVRTELDDEGNPLLCIADVCEILGIDNTSQAAAKLDEADIYRINISSGGQIREMLFTNEYGANILIMRSDKPKARQVQSWLAHEVIPSIRKTGSYSIKSPTELEVARQLVRVLEEKERLQTLVGAERSGDLTITEFFDSIGVKRPTSGKTAAIGRLLSKIMRDNGIELGKSIKGLRPATSRYPRSVLETLDLEHVSDDESDDVELSLDN